MSLDPTYWEYKERVVLRSQKSDLLTAHDMSLIVLGLFSSVGLKCRGELSVRRQPERVKGTNILLPPIQSFSGKVETLNKDIKSQLCAIEIEVLGPGLD